MNYDKTCYLVGVINTETRQLTGVGMFSESSPTLMGNVYPINIVEFSAPTYEEALKRMIDYLNSEMGELYFGWLKDLIDFDRL